MSETLRGYQPEAKEVPKSNPWMELMGRRMGVIKPEPPKPPEVPTDLQEEIDSFEKAEEERYKETVHEAQFRLALDTKAIASIEVPRISSITRIETHPTIEARFQEQEEHLRSVVETMAALPEDLHFSPGVTLIFGENGAGKSTLAKALFLAMRVEDRTRSNKDAAINALNFRGVDTERFKDARKDAEKSLLTITGDTHDVFLRGSGLAPLLARHMKITAEKKKGFVYYHDCTLASGVEETNAYRYYSREDSRHEDLFSHDYRSHRQTVERHLEDLRQDRIRNTMGESEIVFLDEPETGMSPKRHKAIAEELPTHAEPGSIIIVPSNSVVLYNSDLPRIDLDYPERGIFRPSEYKD